MILDTTTLIIGIIVILLAVTSPLMNPFFRRARNKADVAENDAAELPKISVLVIACDNVEGLDKHLPAILTQDYPSDFEVITVTRKGDEEAERVLKHYANNLRLYSTFVPPESLFMSQEKLAVTLGVKAAHNEWVVLLGSECMPVSDKWLATIARGCVPANRLAIGYSNYEETAPPYYRFERSRTSCYLMRKAARGTVYRHNGPNIAFRKSLFIKEDGYRGNLQVIQGTYDFLVNKYAGYRSTAVITSPDVAVREDTPSREYWENRNISYVHTRMFLERSAGSRLLFDFDTAYMYISYIAVLSAIIYGAVVNNWIVASTGVVALVIMTAMRIAIAHKALKRLGERISNWYIIPFELSTIWRNAANAMKYLNSDKRDFSTHKI